MILLSLWRIIFSKDMMPIYTIHVLLLQCDIVTSALRNGVCVPSSWSHPVWLLKLLYRWYNFAQPSRDVCHWKPVTTRWRSQAASHHGESVCRYSSHRTRSQNTASMDRQRWVSEVTGHSSSQSLSHSSWCQVEQRVVPTESHPIADSWKKVILLF